MEDHSSSRSYPASALHGRATEGGVKMRRWLNKLRRKAASWVVGEQVALYLPTADLADAERDNLALDDRALAAVTRHWFAVIRQAAREAAAAEDRPTNVYMTEHAHLTLVRNAVEAGATSYTITQSCWVKGERVGNWRMTLEKIGDDYDFGPNGVLDTVDDEGRVVERSITYGGLPKTSPAAQSGDHEEPRSGDSGTNKETDQ